MKKYLVVGQLTVSAYTEVEAENEEQAIEIAEERLHDVDYSRWGDNRSTEMFLVGEFDGEIVNLHATEQ